MIGPLRTVTTSTTRRPKCGRVVSRAVSLVRSNAFIGTLRRPPQASSRRTFKVSSRSIRHDAVAPSR
jgi:hypothetical protein